MKLATPNSLLLSALACAESGGRDWNHARPLLPAILGAANVGETPRHRSPMACASACSRKTFGSPARMHTGEACRSQCLSPGTATISFRHGGTKNWGQHCSMHNGKPPLQQITVLLTISCLRHLLPGLDESAVLAAVNEHRLAPAFDIGMGSRRLVRVLPSAVAAFKLSQGARRRVCESEMLAETLNGHTDRAHISGEQARLILNCAGGHINALVDDGELEVIRGSRRRLGPGGSDQIILASFKDFLKRRRL